MTRENARVAEPRGSILIEAFEVPPDGDDRFVVGWERARSFLADRGAVRANALHRSLRSDVPLRFLHVALVDSPAAWRHAAADPGFPHAGQPFPAHAGLYEAVHEDGDPDGAGGVLLVAPAEVPAAGEQRFAAAWGAVRELLAPRQGYLGSRLHRSSGIDGFRFVPVVRWSSPLMHARALQEPDIAEAIAALPFPSHPALYLRRDGAA